MAITLTVIIFIISWYLFANRTASRFQSHFVHFSTRLTQPTKSFATIQAPNITYTFLWLFNCSSHLKHWRVSNAHYKCGINFNVHCWQMLKSSFNWAMSWFSCCLHNPPKRNGLYYCILVYLLQSLSGISP
jgi:hypothetical protein